MLSIGITIPGSSNAGPVSPLTIIQSVPVLQWVRADLGITLGTGVSAWADQSGNNHHFAQATGSAQPAYNAADSSLNGKATVNAAAVGAQQLINTTLPLGPNLWISGVAKETARSNAAIWGSRAGQPETTDYYDAGGTGQLAVYSGTIVSSGITLAYGTWRRLEAFYSTIAAYVKSGASTYAGPANTGSNVATGASLFSTTGGAFWTGGLAERIVTQGKPTADEIAALEVYYEGRYGREVLGFGGPIDIFGASSVLQWCRSDRGVIVTTGVAVWDDQTTNNRPYVQSTPASQPVYSAADATLNNQPSITFDGVNDVIFNTTFSLPAPGTTPTTVLVVGKYVSATPNGVLVGDAVGVGGGCILMSINGSVRTQCGTSGPDVPFPLGSWKRVLASWTNSTADKIQVGSNSATGVNVGNSIPAQRAVGSVGVAPGNVAVAEVVYLNKVPSGSEMTAFDASVAARYGAGLV